jgi:hypothetical protein
MTRKENTMSATAAERPETSLAQDIFAATEPTNLGDVLIDVALAEDLLYANKRNRKIRDKKVEQFARAMTGGDWVYNGDAIRVSRTGMLLDGQHRLLAVVRSGVTLRAPIIAGVDDEIQETIDVGTKRTFADMLHLRDEKDTNRLAAGIRNVFLYERYQQMLSVPYEPPPSPQELLRCLERHPGIRAATAGTRPTVKNTGIASGHTIACFYLMGLVDQADRDVFFQTLALGTGLQQGDPIYALRRILMTGSRRLAVKVQAAVLIKAWNAYRAGEERQHLMWRPYGNMPERFPQIEGLDLPAVEA